MSVVKLSEHKPVISLETIQHLRDMADAAERGEIVDLICVANSREEQGFMTLSEFENAWNMLGALEFAKARVVASMGQK